MKDLPSGFSVCLRHMSSGCHGSRQVNAYNKLGAGTASARSKNHRLLKADGWTVGKDRVQRIWRREGLKVPANHGPAAGYA